MKSCGGLPCAIGPVGGELRGASDEVQLSIRTAELHCLQPDRRSVFSSAPRGGKRYSIDSLSRAWSFLRTSRLGKCQISDASTNPV